MSPTVRIPTMTSLPAALVRTILTRPLRTKKTASAASPGT
jgi:hypothetical protein